MIRKCVSCLVDAEVPSLHTKYCKNCKHIVHVLSFILIFVYVSILNGLAINAYGNNVDYYQEHLGWLTGFTEFGITYTIPIISAWGIGVIVLMFHYRKRISELEKK